MSQSGKYINVASPRESIGDSLDFRFEPMAELFSNESDGGLFEGARVAGRKENPSFPFPDDIHDPRDRRPENGTAEPEGNRNDSASRRRSIRENHQVGGPEVVDHLGVRNEAISNHHIRRRLGHLPHPGQLIGTRRPELAGDEESSARLPLDSRPGIEKNIEAFVGPNQTEEQKDRPFQREIQSAARFVPALSPVTRKLVKRKRRDLQCPAGKGRAEWTRNRLGMCEKPVHRPQRHPGGSALPESRFVVTEIVDECHRSPDSGPPKRSGQHPERRRPNPRPPRENCNVSAEPPRHQRRSSCRRRAPRIPDQIGGPKIPQMPIVLPVALSREKGRRILAIEGNPKGLDPGTSPELVSQMMSEVGNTAPKWVAGAEESDSHQAILSRQGRPNSRG